MQSIVNPVPVPTVAWYGPMFTLVPEDGATGSGEGTVELPSPYVAVSSDPMQADALGVAIVYVAFLSIGSRIANPGMVKQFDAVDVVLTTNPAGRWAV
jgi:hypothetical protein